MNPLSDSVSNLVVSFQNMQDEHFITGIKRIAGKTHDTALDKGFDYNSDFEKILLMHSELSEAVEALRAGNPPDDKIPEFSGIEAELADCVLRILGYCHARGFRIAEAILAKTKYNETRPHKHG